MAPPRATPAGRRPRPGRARIALYAALGACAVLGGGALLGPGCGPEPGRPNVLLISIDSLRRDHVSPYGVPSRLAPAVPTTPTFGALAAEGVLFEDAVSTTSWTLPAHTALFTGLPDRLHGVNHPRARIDLGLVTLAEQLGAAGYATGGFWSGPNLHPAFGFSQGFDVYQNCGVEVPLELFEAEELGVFREVHGASHRDVTSEVLLRASTGWIEQVLAADERPFFAFVHFWDPHYDYLPPAEYRTLFDDSYTGRATGEGFIDPQVHWQGRDLDHIRALYDAEIRYTDDTIGRLLARLEELGVGADTLVVITSDHGEEFYEHGKKGHQRNLFEESVRVPLAMRWPGGVPAGVRVPGQARIQDIFPTLCQLLDLSVPDWVEGRSLVPLWEDPEHPGHAQHLLIEVPFRGILLSGLRLGETKVIWDHLAGEGQIYDLGKDASELRPRRFDDLRESSDPTVALLREALDELDRRRAELPLSADPGDALLPPELIEELRRLGYL